MHDDNNARTIVWFLPVSWLKKPLGRKRISQFFWFQEMSLKREILSISCLKNL